MLPDGWLFQGPIGNEPDSMLLKDFKKEDSLDQIDFINKATAAYRKALLEVDNARHLKEMDESVLFDALRVEIFRISSIDVANSDLIIDEAGIPSLNGSMDSWLLLTGELVKELPDGNAQFPAANAGSVDANIGLKQRWKELSAGTRSFLKANTNYQRFDRMRFTRQYLIPLSRFLYDMQQAFGVPFLQRNAAIDPMAKDVYEKNIFNADYFAPDKKAYYTSDKARLGELLFFDPLLSDNNRRACASCHKPALAFTDARKKSVAFGLEDLPRNSPTVINSGFQKRLFWDLRAGSLEDQLDSVVNNVNELHSSFDRVIDRLNASPEYIALFNKAFPDTRTTGITRADVKYALGVYERTLTGLNSRFDRYMRGDESQLSPLEIEGFNVYMGKAKCGVCHIAPLFNGSIPPFYEISDHHSLGVPLKDTMTKYSIDPDLGLMKMDGNVFNRFSFKTPTIRNVALTAPYMHNGAFKTLEQVVDFYDLAAGTQFGKDVRKDMQELPFFTILPIGLKLTPAEKEELVAFLRTLTDTSSYPRSAIRLPRITGRYAGLNKRMVGGDY